MKSSPFLKRKNSWKLFFKYATFGVILNKRVIFTLAPVLLIFNMSDFYLIILRVRTYNNFKQCS